MPLKSQVVSLNPRARIGFLFFTRILLWSSVILLVLTLGRAAAYLLYATPETAAAGSVFRAFVLGFRFDLSAVCYVLALPVLFAGPWIGLAPWGWQKFLFTATRAYLTVMSFLMIFLTVIDLIYYSYFQDHLNIMIFGFFEDDTRALVSTLWKNYPVVAILAGLATGTVLLWWGLGRILNARLPQDPARASLWFLPFHLLAILAVALGGRGSLGLFPLGVADATISNQPFVNYLAFSGLHSLHRAIKLRLRERSVWNINALTYGYEDMRAAAADFLERDPGPSEDPLDWISSTTPENAWARATRPHVVVLVMESFGSYWLSQSGPGFDLVGELSPHLREDYLFLNFVPSMTATIGSLSALMINSPHRPEGGFLTENRYLQVPFRTAPARVYRSHGYRTRFIYGGAVGWRDIDKFARTQGFESVEGDFEIEEKLGRPLEKHDWGLFDEHVWEYLEKTLTEAAVPELVVVMTTSNHPPYQLPAGYRPLPLEIPPSLKARLNVDPTLARARFAAFQYSNRMLGRFMSNLKSSPLGEKTIVAATGDHGFLIVNFKEEDLLRKWQVPFYLYVPRPARPERVDTGVFGSHDSVFPTLMPLSLPGARVAGFGSNMLDAGARHEAYHFSRLAFSKDGAVVVDNAKTARFFQWSGGSDRLAPSPPTGNLEGLAKRYRALMAFLDGFYEHERKNARRNDENPGR